MVASHAFHLSVDEQ